MTPAHVLSEEMCAEITASTRAPSVTYPLELSIVMPCLDEAETIATCIAKALAFLSRAAINGEVVIADNGSRDGSDRIAAAAGARVVHVSERGYGSALLAGITAARGRFVIMGDADDSYDFSRLEAFVECLRRGHDLVMGNRFAGAVLPGAMPFLHRYLGNPVLSFIGRMFFGSPVGDFHCGLRGFERTAILDLALQCPGMEFASEMVVKATLAGLRICEVPTTLSPDGRSRRPHLRTWRDGWRHLKFLLLMSPRWLLLVPGCLLLGMGALTQLAIARGPIVLGGVGFDIHTMLYASAMTVVGVQLVLLSVVAQAIGCLKGLLRISDPFRQVLRRFSLERGIVIGAATALVGMMLAVYSVHLWAASGLAALDPAAVMRYAIPSVTLIITGTEVMFVSFVLGFVDVQRLIETRMQ